MLSAKALDKVDEYWTNYLGCSLDDFDATLPLVVQHSQALEDYVGLFIFIKGKAIVVSVPQELLKQMSKIARTWTAELLLSHGFLEEECSFLRPKMFIGPAYIGYSETIQLPKLSDAKVRMLNRKDSSHIVEFQAKVNSLEWDHGGSDIVKNRVLGVFVDDTLAAVAGYKVWGNIIAHISIVVNSDYRSKGYGRLAVSSIAHNALKNNLVPQYRTLMANEESVGLARALNFTHYATTMSIRL